MPYSEKFLKVIANALPENTSVMAGVGVDADAVLMAMQDMEAQAEAAGWDEPPEIMLVFSFPEALGMRTFPVPDLILEDMGENLPFLVELIEQGDPTGMKLLSQVLPENFFGIAIRNEGWSLSSTAPNATEAALTGQVHLHPERVEMRFVVCYTLDGRMRAVTRHRGKMPESYEMTEEMIAYAQIPDLLRRLTLACRDHAPSFVTERLLPE